MPSSSASSSGDEAADSPPPPLRTRPATAEEIERLLERGGERAAMAQLVATCLALARAPAAASGSSSKAAAAADCTRTFGHLNTKCASAVAPEAPSADVHVPLLRMAWTLLQGSPAKLAEVPDAALSWAKNFLMKHLHPRSPDSYASKLAGALDSALTAELEAMAVSLHGVACALSPAAPTDAPAAAGAWPKPPNPRPPAALPSAVALAQAVDEIRAISEVAASLRSRPVPCEPRQSAAAACRLLQAVGAVVERASAYMDLVHAMAPPKARPAPSSILPACLHDAKPLLRIAGICFELAHADGEPPGGCPAAGAAAGAARQQAQELHHVRGFKVQAMCRMLKERLELQEYAQQQLGQAPHYPHYPKGPAQGGGGGGAGAAGDAVTRAGAPAGTSVGAAAGSSSGGDSAAGRAGVEACASKEGKGGSAAGEGAAGSASTTASGKGGGGGSSAPAKAGAAGEGGSGGQGTGGSSSTSKAGGWAAVVAGRCASSSAGEGGGEGRGTGASAGRQGSKEPPAAPGEQSGAAAVGTSSGGSGSSGDEPGAGAGSSGQQAGGGGVLEGQAHQPEGIMSREAVLAAMRSLVCSTLVTAHQIKATDLIGKQPVLPFHLELRGCLPDAVRMDVIHAIFPKKKQGSLDHHATITLRVERRNLLGTSLHQLQRQEPHMLARRPLCLKFKGEEGTGSGVVRDWLSQLSKELCDGNYGLFDACGTKGSLRTIHPSPAGAEVHGDELPKIMRAAGLVLGLSMCMRVPLGVQLSAAAFDQALGRRMTLEHLEELDPTLAASCRAVLAAPPEDVEPMGLHFVAANHNHLGAGKEEVALCAGGEQRAVTAGNREEYVALLTAHCCSRGSTRAAAEQLVQGLASASPWFTQRFHKNPVEMLAGVCAKDLGVLLRGSDAGVLSVADWRAHTSTHKFNDPKGKAFVATFWQALEEDLTAQEHAALLQFWTGYANLPLGGFRLLPAMPQLWCSNEGADQGASSEQLPQAHTCFMQLTLPRYTSRAALVTALRTALKHSEGFDMV